MSLHPLSPSLIRFRLFFSPFPLLLSLVLYPAYPTFSRHETLIAPSLHASPACLEPLLVLEDPSLDRLRALQIVQASSAVTTGAHKFQLCWSSRRRCLRLKEFVVGRTLLDTFKRFPYQARIFFPQARSVGSGFKFLPSFRLLKQIMRL